MNYYLIAGEASGDLHGSNLIRQLKKLDQKAEFRCFGGDLMEQAGGHIALHYRKMSFIGIWEVVKNIRTINKTLEFCREDLLDYHPDVVILIDYPGFNLKIAEFAREKGYKTIYYIAPKVWASRKSRIKRIQKCVDKLYVILPFEEKYFNERQCKAEYLGNPLTDAIANFKPYTSEEFRLKNKLDERPIIALLAGSRKMEISLCLPEMLNACKDLVDYQLVIAGAPSIQTAFYDQYTSNFSVRIVFNETYDLLANAAAAVVVSGTATLETALFNVPEVVLYKLSTPTFIIGRPFVHIRFFSLVNIILDRQVVKELLQFNLSRDIRKELNLLLYDNDYRKTMLEAFAELNKIIGKPGTSGRVAKSIFKFLNN
jgi:lipid-A-disaccharide synthase